MATGLQNVDLGTLSTVDTNHHFGYRTSIAARLAGITYRQIDHWDTMDVLKPSLQQADGSGSSRRYSVDDVKVLAVLRELTRLGAPLQNLADAEVVVRAALDEGPRWLIVTPESFVDVCSDDMIAITLDVNDVNGAWIVDVETVLAKLDV